MRPILPALLLLMAATAFASNDCDDDFPRALNVAIPRTASFSTDAINQTRHDVLEHVQRLYSDRCGKDLQINFALGSDYEILDWLSRGSVDLGIVPDLSLWLLARDSNVVELDPSAIAVHAAFPPYQPAPECRQLARGEWKPCAQTPAAVYARVLQQVAQGETPRVRLLFASHLSSTGFLDPMERAAKWFAAREKTEKLWEDYFAIARFAVDPERAASAYDLAVADDDPKERDGMTVLFFPGEEMLDAGAGGARGPLSRAEGYRLHLVARADVAAKLFRNDVMPGFAPVDAEKRSPRLVAPELASMLAAEHPPRQLEVIANAEPLFGVRSFRFTVSESLRLLEQQQRSSGSSRLALVLPGGGVKAAYQSGVVDHLYSNGLLRNAGAARPGDRGGLTVKSVLGTSGGALLGYFVSQLGPNGPFNLADLLWYPNRKPLDKSSVFGVTDLPAYFAMVWTFIVFAVLFGLVTGRHSSIFYVRSRTKSGSWRWRLMLVPLIVLLVPVLLIFAGGEVEHVPVVEGLIYTLMTLMVMFADQCLIYTPRNGEEHEPSTRRTPAVMLFVTGVAMLLFTTSGIARGTLQQPVTFGLAFATLSLQFLGGTYLLLYIHPPVSSRARRGIPLHDDQLASASGSLAQLGMTQRNAWQTLASIIAVLLACAFGLPDLVPQFGQAPAVLMLLLLSVWMFRHAHSDAPKSWLMGIATFLSLALTALICWSPRALKDGTLSLGWNSQFLMADSLNITLARFLTSMAAVVIVLSAILFVYRSPRYSFDKERSQKFALGLLVLSAHSVATAGLVWVVAQVPPFRGRIHLLELTGSFWLTLTIVAMLVTVAILFAAARLPWQRPREVVEFLCSEHENGALVPRRYVRMAAVAVLSVIWWNAIVAPALYGNGNALDYLRKSARAFDDAFRAAHGITATTRGFLPTAQFVASTNTLESGGATHYFMFVGPDDKQPVIPKKTGGAKWLVYRTTGNPAIDCANTLRPGCVDFVQDVVFSSGSPFPIFAAHKFITPEGDPMALIDGGYSNVIPVDAARAINAKQALIIHSANPFGPEHAHNGEPPLLRPGTLIRNALRLFPFMFSRSQEVDRLSKQNLMCVALAPLPEEGELWPGLAQFDAPTVEQVVKEAREDVRQRIGFVESWGEPRFRFSEPLAIP